MSKATHTPGPWNQCAACSSDYRSIRYMGSPEGENIADVREPAGMSQSEALANARLIVAAPELLALARQYLSDLRHPPTGDSLARRLARAESIISKAEGV